MSAPNIVDVSSIIGKTSVQIVRNSATPIITNVVGSGKVLKVNALYVSNIDSSLAYKITAEVYRNSISYRFVYNVVVPIGAALDILGKSIYLEEGDSIRLISDTDSKIEAVASYEEIS